MNWLDRFLAKRNMGACICEGAEINAACNEIERLRGGIAWALERATDGNEHEVPSILRDLLPPNDLA